MAEIKETKEMRETKVRRAVYECVNQRCLDGGERTRDVLKLFPEEPLPSAIPCWNCHGGLQGTGPAPQPGGMQFVEYQVEEGEADKAGKAAESVVH